MKNFKIKIALGLIFSIFIVVLAEKYFAYQYVGSLIIIISFMMLYFYLMKLCRIYQKYIEELLSPYLNLFFNIFIIFCIGVSLIAALHQGEGYISTSCRIIGIFGVGFFGWFLFKVVIPKKRQVEINQSNHILIDSKQPTYFEFSNSVGSQKTSNIEVKKSNFEVFLEIYRYVDFDFSNTILRFTEDIENKQIEYFLSFKDSDIEGMKNILDTPIIFSDLKKEILNELYNITLPTDKTHYIKQLNNRFLIFYKSLWENDEKKNRLKRSFEQRSLSTIDVTDIEIKNIYIKYINFCFEKSYEWIVFIDSVICGYENKTPALQNTPSYLINDKIASSFSYLRVKERFLHNKTISDEKIKTNEIINAIESITSFEGIFKNPLNYSQMLELDEMEQFFHSNGQVKNYWNTQVSIVGSFIYFLRDNGYLIWSKKQLNTEAMQKISEKFFSTSSTATRKNLRKTELFHFILKKITI